MDPKCLPATAPDWFESISLTHLGASRGLQFASIAWDLTICRVDVDHSGSLDFPEFLRFYPFQVILFFLRNLSKPKLTFLCSAWWMVWWLAGTLPKTWGIFIFIVWNCWRIYWLKCCWLIEDLLVLARECWRALDPAGRGEVSDINGPGPDKPLFANWRFFAKTSLHFVHSEKLAKTRSSKDEW